MAKHTPGPWVVDDGDSPVLGIFCLDGNAICYLSSNVIRTATDCVVERLMPPTPA